jgi:hypothetical protein
MAAMALWNQMGRVFWRQFPERGVLVVIVCRESGMPGVLAHDVVVSSDRGNSMQMGIGPEDAFDWAEKEYGGA